ncbi:MAG: ComEC/Rec2 family competence protein [Patescibacteria group bacterium]
MVPDKLARQKPLIILTLFLSCILVWLSFFLIPYLRLQVWFLDVGQGDSMLIRTPERHLILIDGGPDDSVLTRLGAVLPFWCRELDLVVLTHPDSDHVSGLNSVLTSYSVGSVMITGQEADTKTYKIFKDSLIENGIDVLYSKPGKAVISGDVYFNILWPPQDLSGLGSNDTSIVVQLDYRDFEALFLGDLEQKGQEKLLAAYTFSPLEVFKTPHHGADCLQESFISQVQPFLSVVSVGKDNPYNHPSENTLHTLDRFSKLVFRTDKVGTVEVVTDGFLWGYK